MTDSPNPGIDNEFLFVYLWRLMCLGAVGTRYISSKIILNSLPADCARKALQALRYLILEGFVITKTAHSLDEISLNPKRVDEVKSLIRRMEELD